MVIDRSRIFAEALADRLDREPDMSVIAVRVPPSRPTVEGTVVDVIVCDDKLTDPVLGPSGQRVRRPPHVVVLAERGDDDLGSSLIARGAAAWVTRDSSSSHLLAAMRGVHQGETWVPPDLLTAVIDELATRQRQDRSVTDRLNGLTVREREVLDLLARGMDREQVAKELNLSRNTVRTHVQNILGRLDVHSTLAAVAIGREPPVVSPAFGGSAHTSAALRYVQ